MYERDYDDTALALEGFCGWNQLGQTGLPWIQKLQPYVNNMQIFRCPSGQSAIGYSMNAWSMSWVPAYWSSAWGPIGLYSSDQSPAPAQAMWVFDAELYAVGGGTDYTDGSMDCDPTNEGLVGEGYANSFTDLAFPGTHNDGNNVLYQDGHVKWIKAIPGGLGDLAYFMSMR
jgi:prepilin-type processing-associated H-X9-DG protein